MEPFRPIVDEAVFRIVERTGPQTPLDKESKAALIGALANCRLASDGDRTLFDVSGRCASSLAAVFAGERRDLMLPEV